MSTHLDCNQIILLERYLVKLSISFYFVSSSVIYKDPIRLRYISYVCLQNSLNKLLPLSYLDKFIETL